MTKLTSRHSLSRIWRWPAALAGLTLFGLLSALLGQTGIWWALSWIALSIPLVVIAFCAYLRDTAGGIKPGSPRSGR
jgi:dolichyl-phosphate-mannose--protein O-mannosyl transferase